ncbi:MAG: four helix bundle protein [Kofleriaceae bacterium]|nr:four helix bundle protein [Kofleriaceae bacterium]MCB9575204.1 four helix bundle protein [Kofleriaceae bacterium]
MNHTISPSRLLSRFVAYRCAVAAAERVQEASRNWRGAASLVDQARRAATSVVLNLAEGNAHPPGSPDRRRYQRIALGSALELEAALDVAAVSGLGRGEDLAAAVEAAGRSAALCTALCRPR